MSKVRSVFKYIFLSLSVLTTSFIIYHSALSEEKSSAWSNSIASFVSKILNDDLGIKEDVKVVSPESISLSLSNYAYNHIEGYLDNEIPLGCTKQLSASILPSDTSNKSVKFSAYPSECVNIIQSGSNVSIEGLKCGNVAIQSTSVADNSLVASYSFDIVDLKAPSTFTLDSESIEISKGLSKYLSINISETNLGDDKLLTTRYYDIKKLSYSSSNSDIAYIDDNGYIIGKNIGEAVITVSNETLSKTVNVSVKENNNELIYPTNMSIIGSDTVYVLDMDYDRSEKGQHNTQLSIDWEGIIPSDTNVIWSVDKPLVARIDEDGVVRGYRNTSNDDVEFNVTAVSVMNPNISTTFKMYSRQVLPTTISVTTKTTLNEDGTYHVYNGQSLSFTVSFGPNNVTKKDYIVTSSDKSIVNPVGSGSSLTIYGLGDGTCDITVISTYNSDLSYTFKVTSITRPYVNDSNYNDFSKFLRKYVLGHAGLFLLNALFLSLYLCLAHLDKKNIAIKVIPCLTTPLIMFALAGLSEFIQSFVPGRTCAWSDVLIDMGGVWTGFVISIIIILLIYLSMAISYRKQNSKKS